jgi:DNA-binding NarL/FixJ family response regulator
MTTIDRILLADDHPLFRMALTQAITQEFPGASISEAEDFPTLQSLVEREPNADLLLLDLNIPGVQGFSGLAFIRGHHPGLPVVIISAHDDAGVVCRAIDHGAAGFISKSSPIRQISDALRCVIKGDIWLPPGIEYRTLADREEASAASGIGELTPQQFRVLGMLSTGLLNKQIAYELDVSEATVKAHVTAIMKKLGVNNRTQAVLAATRLGVLPENTDDAKAD